MEYQDPVVLELCRRHGEADPEALIIRLCRELVAQVPAVEGPSRLDVLGSIRGIRNVHHKPITPRAGSNCSGYLYVVDGGYEVVVNSNEPGERQWFSEGHEVVHTFFREVAPSALPSDEEEHLCELGAAELVMPVDRFLAHLQAVGVTFDGLHDCRREFGASFEACGQRAMRVTDEAACFLVAKLKRRQHEELLGTGTPRLRVDHWTASRSWPDQGCYRGLSFAPDSLIVQAFEQQDSRAAQAELGTRFHNGVYHIEAVGYSYMRNGHADHRQVCALLRLQ